MTLRVCFVCLGNICRSPTAEAIMNDLVAQAGVGGEVSAESAGTGDWHVGEPPDARSAAAALARGVPLAGRARQFAAGDYARARRKVSLLRAHDADARGETDVPDPYYGGDDGFDVVFDICEAACRGLLARIVREHGLG